MAIRVNAGFQAVYIHEPLGHDVPALNTAWTVAGLYRPDADVNQDTLIVALYGTTAAASWVGLYMNADGITCRLEGYNGGSPVVSSSYTLEVGRDYRLAIDYNGSGTVRMLLDGVAVLTLSFTPNAGTLGERSLQWGGYGELTGYTDCTIARWRMWSAVLTEAEHRAEYRSLVPVRTSGLLHNWPMVAGATRFDDTVSGQPDLVDNPAVPCGDGTDFILRPSIIGTPQFFDLGQTTTPGAQSVTVPTYAEHVGIHIIASDDAAAPYADLASLAANFISAFTRTNGDAPVNASAAGGWVATAPVNNFTAGRTFTPAFTQGSALAGAHAVVYFIQDTTGATARGAAQATGDGTAAGTASAAGLVDGLALALDTRLSATTSAYPTVQSGWRDQPPGTAPQTTGAFAYWACSRLRSKPITASGTETATTQETFASVLTMATWAPRALAGGTITGTLSKTLGAMTASAAGTVRVSGSATRTMAAATLTAAGTVRVTGQASRTLSAMTLAAAGAVRASGALTATMGAATLSASGVVGSTPIAGAANITLGAMTAAGTGAVSVSGALSATLGSMALAAAGGVRASGALSATLGGMTLAAAGGVRVSGALNATMQAMTVAASGGSSNVGTLTATLAAMGVGAAGTVRVAGAASLTMGALSLAAVGGVRITGSAAANMGAMSLNAGGTVRVSGGADVMMGGLQLAASGGVLTRAGASILMGAMGISASGGLAVRGTLSATLGGMTLQATGFNGDGSRGELNATLGAMTLQATGVVLFGFTPSEARTWRVAAEDRRRIILREERTHKVA